MRTLLVFTLLFAIYSISFAIPTISKWIELADSRSPRFRRQMGMMGPMGMMSGMGYPYGGMGYPMGMGYGR
ncbi:hypothetical protein V3C99_010452 [Haemonchus contortus]|uniref:Uncharacterized protein n=1 Tax=Haemonchus contortus TaxID=6289 RepID=A0A7I4Y922_HAECO